MVYRRTTDVKVLLGRSSNPTLGDFFFFWPFTFTGTLHWTGNQRHYNWPGFESKIDYFFLLGEPILFIILVN